MILDRAHIDDAYFAQDKIPAIEPEIVKRLSRLKPWRSMFAIVLDWSVIVLCIVLCEMVSYWFYPLAFIIVGTRYHGLEAMMHDATHYRLHSNKTVNDVVGELSVWPMGLSVYLYRYLRHFSHHKSIGTLKDAHIFQSYKRYPERFDIPTSGWQLFKNCIVAALHFPDEVWVGQIYRSAKLFPAFSKKRGRVWIGLQLATFLFVVAGSFVWGFKVAAIYFLFFVLPLIWVAVFSRYLRLLTEHFGIPGAQSEPFPGSATRTVLVSWPIRVFFWPHHLNYHVEHHWYPSVPFYNLPELHRHLYASPAIRERMYITRGLKNLIAELTAKRIY